MARCVMCGGPEHRDADGMVERCEVVPLTRDPRQLMLRELFWWPEPD